MADRVIDQRESVRASIPASCPECGTPITVIPEESTSYASGPADLATIREHGIEGDGPVVWRSLDWLCSAHPDDHYVGAPVSLADGHGA